MKVFCGGIVDVRHEPLRILLLHRPVQSLQIPFNLLAAEPPNNRCRDFIAERIAEKRWMAGAATRFASHQLFDVRGALSIDEIARVLFGGEPDHDAKAMLLSDIEKLPRWR